jgi:hypothetical protein
MQANEGSRSYQHELETLKHARSIFQTCYLSVTGKAAWDD